MNKKRNETRETNTEKRKGREKKEKTSNKKLITTVRIEIGRLNKNDGKKRTRKNDGERETERGLCI